MHAIYRSLKVIKFVPQEMNIDKLAANLVVYKTVPHLTLLLQDMVYKWHIKQLWGDALSGPLSRLSASTATESTGDMYYKNSKA